MEKKVKEELALRSLELDAFDYMVVFSRIFEGKARSFQDFKLHFLGTLYSWSQVPDHGTKSTFLDFVDRVVVKSLRA